MFDFVSLREKTKLKNQTICLKKTTKIKKEHLKDPVWKELKAQYKVAADDVLRACCSITNAIYTQKRVHFFISREILRDLIVQDSNHKSKSAFNNGSYAFILMQLLQMGIIEKVDNNHYKCTLVEVLNFIDVNTEEQKQEVIDFSNKNQKKHLIPDRNSDRSADTDNIVIKKYRDIDNKDNVGIKILDNPKKQLTPTMLKFILKTESSVESLIAELEKFKYSSKEELFRNVVLYGSKFIPEQFEAIAKYYNIPWTEELEKQKQRGIKEKQKYKLFNDLRKLPSDSTQEQVFNVIKSYSLITKDDVHDFYNTGSFSKFSGFLLSFIK